METPKTDDVYYTNDGAKDPVVSVNDTTVFIVLYNIKKNFIQLRGG